MTDIPIIKPKHPRQIMGADLSERFAKHVRQFFDDEALSLSPALSLSVMYCVVSVNDMDEVAYTFPEVMACGRQDAVEGGLSIIANNAGAMAAHAVSHADITPRVRES